MGYFDRVESGLHNDKYACKTTGVVVDLAEINHSICSLTINEHHLSYDAAVSSGAIFTLIDYAFGVAANEYIDNAVTLTADVNFVRRSNSSKLFAETKCIQDGDTIALYETTVTDIDGVVAIAIVNGFRSNKE